MYHPRLLAWPAHTEIAAAILKLRLAEDAVPGRFVELAAGGATESNAPGAVRFVAAGRKGDWISVEVGDLARGRVSGQARGDWRLHSAGTEAVRFAGHGDDRPRLELISALTLQAEDARLLGGAAAVGEPAPDNPIRLDDTMPDWALDMQKRGCYFDLQKGAELKSPGDTLEFAGLPAAGRLRIRYSTPNDAPARLELLVNGRSQGEIVIPAPTRKRYPSETKLRYRFYHIERVLDIPAGAALQLRLAPDSPAVTLDYIQIKGG